MSEKIKVSQEVADALDLAKKKYSDEIIVDMNIKRSFCGDLACLDNLHPYKLAKILVLGYEIEQTPEEKWAQKYKDAVAVTENFAASMDRKLEAKGTLITIIGMARDFNLNIEGVND